MMPPKPSLLRNPLFYLALILFAASLAGGLGSQRATACLDEAPRFDTLLHGLAWAWGGLSLAFGGFALSFGIPGVRHKLTPLSSRRVIVPLLLFYFTLLIFCLLTFLVVINIPCLTATAWVSAIWMLGGLLGIGLLLPNFRARLALMMISLLLTLIFLEGGYRFYLRLFPIDSSWILQMDDQIGWRHVPELEREWAGRDPTCVSFRTPMKINSAGFYDAERTLEKPDGTLRIAMLGDSFVEAAQVPFEQRASQMLQARLAADMPDQNFEVLNFGVSNFGVGQFWLTYQAYAREYHPDYVFVLIFNTQLLRAVPNSGYEVGGESTTSLQLRPTFQLDENGRLQVTPPSPADQQTYEALLAEKVLDEDGKIKPNYVYSAPPRVSQGLWGNPYDWLISRAQFGRFMSHRITALWTNFAEAYFPLQAAAPQSLSYYDYIRGSYALLPSETNLIALHIAILDQFYRAVKADGAELVILNFATPPVYDVLNYFAQDNHLGVVDLSTAIQNASRQADLTFLCDGHWNQRGNQVAAASLFDWLHRRLVSAYPLWGSDQMTVFEQPDRSWQVYRIENGNGIFEASFSPDQAPLKLTAPDGWQIDLSREGQQYRVRLSDPAGHLVSDALVVSAFWGQ